MATTFPHPILTAALALTLGGSTAVAQTEPLATAGTEFWLGFMQNAYGAQALRVQIAAQSNASGTVSMPLVGWSAPFAVAANGSVTIDVPVNAEHTGSETVMNKALLVQSDDSVTVTAVSYQSFTTDAAQALPTPSLGTVYRAEAYRGLPGFAEFYKSEILIVATQDGTQITITPTVATSGGHAAGVPFNVSLNAGETYQVQGAQAALDLTGTSVVGTAQSGPCRPFAVFSGSMCANVPVTCPACDHVFEQMVPTNRWGTSFHSIDFNNTTGHTLRVLADQNGTLVAINGGAPIALNAGASAELNATTAACITSNQPISVVQFMEGFNCASSGDPSMIELLPDERRSTKATFSTLASAQITAHGVSVLMPTANIGQLTLDGAVVNTTLFQAYPACAGFSRAKLLVSSGTHTLQASGGFIAYASGTGTGESYAFSIGRVALTTQPPPPVICSTDPITLSASVPIINAEWTLESDPGVVIATGPSYTFTPQQNDTYILDGEMPVSGCPYHDEWQVGVPAQLTLDVTADGLQAGDICQFGSIQLNAVPAPDPNVFDLTWTPSASLSDATIPDPMAYPTTDTWFLLNVVSPVGCGQVSDSVFVNVEASDVYAVNVTATDTDICAGDNTTLQARAERVTAFDAFDAPPSALWASIQGGTTSAACGAVSGSALRFDAAGVRRATTVPLNMSTGAALHFALKIGAAAAPCDDAEPGDDVFVEFSPDGSIWTSLAMLNESAYPNWTQVDLSLPAAAQTATTRFRWSQSSNSGAGTDNWALDNVVITHYNNSGITFSWSPAATLNNPSIASPQATPTSDTDYQVIAQNATGCQYLGQVHIDVAAAFSVSASNDTTLCTAGTPIPLQATPSSGVNATYAWTPDNGSLSSASSQNPVATPGSTTTYSVTATSDLGCTDTETVTITVGQLQSIDVSATDTQLCQGENTLLTALVSGGSPFTIAWTPADGTLSDLSGANTTATPTSTTTYTATATETASGCTLSEAITVNASPQYIIDAGPDEVLCTTLGHQLSVVHNVPLPQYQWSNAALLNASDIGSPTIMFDTVAIYIVTITDPLGCSVSDTVSITDAFDALITPINMDACAGEDLVLDAEFPGSTYEWNTNATTQTITVVTSGSYVCTITDPQGCQAVKTFIVTFNALPAVDLGPDTSLCGASSFILDANSPGNDVLWSTMDLTQQISVSQTDTYSVTVTGPQGCENSDAVQVTFNQLPTDDLADVTACVSTPPTLDAGNGGSTYLWNTNASTSTIVADQSTTYSVIITTPAQCSATYDAVVTLMPLVAVDLGADTTLCEGQVLMLDAGGPGLTYDWSTGAQTQTINATSSALYSVLTSNGYCSDSDAIDVTFEALPVDVLNDQTSCIDAPVTLDAGNAGCSFLWSTNAATQQITVSTAGSYSVLVTNEANCSNTFDATVTFVGYPVVDLGPDTVLCEGDVLDIDAGNSGASFTWSNGAQTQVISVETTGSYGVQVDNGYCVSHDSVFAVFNPRPNRLLTHQFFTCLEEEPHYVTISAGNPGSSYDWSTGETEQVILAGAYGWYFVSVTNQFDCTQNDSAVVHEFCPPSIYVPNTFTPNGDGTNDVWLVSGKSIGRFDMNVFDRWGGVIFHSEDPRFGWDGNIDGKAAPNDVYVWRMEYRFIEEMNGDEGVGHKQLGHVIMMR